MGQTPESPSKINSKQEVGLSHQKAFFFCVIVWLEANRWLFEDTPDPSFKHQASEVSQEIQSYLG